MKTLKLSKRLETVAAFVETGSNVADIGTDHGYIPVYLAQNGISVYIAASDLRKGPLEQARGSAAEYEVSDRIDFILADGLERISADKVDTVIIAGMGGETILKILSAAPDFRRQGMRFILQPQSKIVDLTAWLCDNGFKMTAAKLVREDNKLYTVIAAEYDGHCGKPVSVEDLLYSGRDALLPGYLDAEIVKLRRAIKGMELGENVPDIEKHKSAELLEKYSKMRELVVKW